MGLMFCNFMKSVALSFSGAGDGRATTMPGLCYGNFGDACQLKELRNGFRGSGPPVTVKTCNGVRTKRKRIHFPFLQGIRGMQPTSSS